MTIWQPGMRCVCVELFDCLDGGAEPIPLVKGRVYTVRSTDWSAIAGTRLLRLQECDNRHLIGREFELGGEFYRYIDEPGYTASQFRPLSETRLDVFRNMLAPTSRQTAEASS